MSALRLLALVIIKNKPANKKKTRLQPSLFFVQLHDEWLIQLFCHKGGAEAEMRKEARAAAPNAYVETLFKTPGSIYRAGRKILVII